MLKPEDRQRYLNESDFVAKVLNLKEIDDKTIRMIVRPSFHAEQVWDIDDKGKVVFTFAMESIWVSIPWRVKIGGEKKWSYKTFANFDLEKIREKTIEKGPVKSSDLISALREYNHPKIHMLDGISFVFLYKENGNLISNKVQCPRKSRLLNYINKIIAEMDKRGLRHDIKEYLQIA
jgi:hypothetical protein